MTTTDYNALDTAALVAAADALTAGITPGVWEQNADGSMSSNHGEYVVHVNRYGVLRIDDADAAFIAAAPALVKALVARLRECENVPSTCKFKVGDKVKAGNMRYGTGVDVKLWPGGQVFTVLSVVHKEEVWKIYTDAYQTTDWIAAFLESELELVPNG
jgi:hypothetical protein